MALASLRSFEDWRTCIEVACRIKLTLPYVRERLAELTAVDHHKTRRFVEMWGESHRLRVVAWFQEAERRLESASA